MVILGEKKVPTAQIGLKKNALKRTMIILG